MEQFTVLIEPILPMLRTAQSWVLDELVSLSSLYQIAAVLLTYFIARLARRPFSRFCSRFETGERKALKNRVLRLISSLSMPVVWTILLWVAASVLASLGESIVLVRLLASLINAWVVIRIATLLIPNEYWSGVFTWIAWSFAALSAVGLLKPIIAYLDGSGFSLGETHISLWTLIKAVAVTGILIWGAVTIAGLASRRMERSETLNPSMSVLLGKLLRIALIVLAVVIGGFVWREHRRRARTQTHSAANVAAQG